MSSSARFWILQKNPGRGDRHGIGWSNFIKQSFAMKKALLSGVILFTLFFSLGCKKDEAPEEPAPVGPRLIFRFAFNPDQERLNNIGQPAGVPAGHAAQSPDFRGISAHYFELAPTALTPLGAGEVLYHAPETDAGGGMAIDFSKAIIKDEGENYIAVPLSSIAAGNYEYMRVSLAYQNYNIQVRQSGLNFSGTIASFVGFNTYIGTYSINQEQVVVNDDRLQGYWGFEANVFGTPYVLSGQAPPGATTVPNPIWNSSPIPAGSCVVTGPFAAPLTITGNETEDIIVTLSLSTNNSFELVEVTEDGLYEPAIGEQVVDMGLRGLIPIVN
jgi:hypothetical protein